MKYIPNPPQPKMAESLRELGYSTVYASADILDNSLDAIATIVSIWISNNKTQKDPATQIDFFDNGSGMTESEVNEALTYGSESDKSASALGCFGLGLNTAGTSLARRITLITRAGPDEELLCRVLDLDTNIDQKGFVIGVREVTPDEAERFNAEIGDSSGTWVSLSKIDSDEYKNIKTVVQALKSERTLRLIFRKFLASRTCSIFVNGAELEPYGYDYVDGVETIAKSMAFILKDGTALGTVKIISTVDTRFTGGKGQQRPQGLVVVRNNRDITPTVTWKGLVTHDWRYNGVYAIWEVTAAEFDSLMGTTVMKNDWKLPQDIGDQLKKLINPHLMTYKKMRQMKIKMIKSGMDESAIEEVIKSYGTNFNKNRNITPKPKPGNNEKVNRPTRRPGTNTSSKPTNPNPPTPRKYKHGNDEWVFNCEPECGSGRYYVWGAQAKQRGGMRYTITIDSKHPWVAKHFASDFVNNYGAMYAIMDMIMGDVYMEIEQESTEAADNLIYTKSNFLRARANVTTPHDATPVELAAK